MDYTIRLHRYIGLEKFFLFKKLNKKVQNGQKIRMFLAVGEIMVPKFIFSFKYLYIQKKITYEKFLKGRPSPPGSFYPKGRGGVIVPLSRIVLKSELMFRIPSRA